MTTYNVLIPRKDEYIQKDRERYPNSKPIITRTVGVNIDLLITIIYY